MVEVFDNVITEEENRYLLKYVNEENEFSDHIINNMHRKNIDIEKTPELTSYIENILTRVLPKPFKIYSLMSFDHRVEIKLHTHGTGAPGEYRVTTLMLECPPNDGGGSIFFDNCTINCAYSNGMSPEKITNYVDQPFPEDIRSQYCSFLSPEIVHGLTFERCVEWKPNRIMTFPTNQIHGASSGAKGKKFMLALTKLV